MIEYNKLVRDKILDILKKKKIKYKYHTANKKEYLDKLYEKLDEEIAEFKKEPSVEEFADILEVLDSIGQYYKFNLDNVKSTKKQKKEEKGGFKKKIILEITEE